MRSIDDGQAREPNAPPPWYSESGSSGHADAGIAQVVLTAVLVAMAFFAGWFGNSFVNRANIATGDQRLIIQAWNDIDQNFVVTGAIDHKKMAYSAIQAMVDSLGDTGHSRFETPEQLKAEQNQLNNAPTVGIGVYLSGGGGSQPLTIDAIIPNSPASHTSLRPGDEIVAVDGTSIKGKTFDQVHGLIAGQEGTKVTLTIIRPSVSPTATTDVVITRGKFVSPTVASFMIPGENIDDIVMYQFAQDADSAMGKAIKAAQDAHAKGIILDLRGNPGGLLDQAVAVTSEFVPSGKTVLIEKSRGGTQKETSTCGCQATQIPLVILVDNNTASAAEITAGSIAINRPGVHVVGQTTFGTGTILTEFVLSDGSALWLGASEWLLPNGQSVYHKGYTPDQQVALPQNATPLSPLVAQQENYTEQQVLNSGDTQLIQAINDLNG